CARGWPMGLDADDRATLMRLARTSVYEGLKTGRPFEPELAACSPALRADGASFVTLEIDDRLRGCIGRLEASRPLAIDVAHNAFSAAFEDPRFPALTAAEWPGLHFHVSVLGKPVPFPVADEADLIARLRPGVDGLVLREGHRRATFLPSVWQSLPDPAEFVAHLKHKAGWSTRYWSPHIEVQRYEVEAFE
ncbi:MAG: AmmeMemoRadiSam system protein A, partial [Myxococcales bacterium]|nr:AmmeMemoRadiSam system protein A [Myxococcales bacterium]